MQFLSFSLIDENQFMLPGSNLAEVLSLDPSQIAPIPDMHPSVMGVCNWRGQVLWVVYLAHILGFGGLFSQGLSYPKHSIIVIRSQGKFLGLAVHQMGSSLRYEALELQPPPTILNPQMQVLSLCLKGQIASPQAKKMPVLDADAIVNFLAQRAQHY
ncbi:chemotaxis protein CheW [Microseira sp. BLCC-F43]|jgi:positive phototaxis protein PixI|uniref:chemotaxis protein CheW n=1 Tax=Microseira sp. BLCC-F43 TaxID=3153602 RepID=UPI0035B8150F